MHALNHIACYAVRGSLRTDEAQRLLGVTAGDLEDLNIAVVELREETYTICGHALVLRGRTLPHRTWVSLPPGRALLGRRHPLAYSHRAHGVRSGGEFESVLFAVDVTVSENSAKAARRD